MVALWVPAYKVLLQNTYTGGGPMVPQCLSNQNQQSLKVTRNFVKECRACTTLKTTKNSRIFLWLMRSSDRHTLL